MCHGIIGHHPPSPRSPKHLAMHQSFLLPLRRAWPAEPPADTLFFKSLEVLIGKGREGMSLCPLIFLFTWTQTGWGFVSASHQCNTGNKPASWNSVSFMQPKPCKYRPCKLWLHNWLHSFPWAHTNSWKPSPKATALTSMEVKQKWGRCLQELLVAEAIPGCRSINALTERVHELFQQAPC